MARTRDLLERFRPAGAPGAAAPAGVPSVHAASLREELLPVLALLEPTESEVDAVHTDASTRAERISADARTRAAELAAQARARADEARAEAAARQQRQGDEALAVELGHARQDAARLQSAARERVPALVSRVLSLVREELLPDGAATSSPPPPTPEDVDRPADSAGSATSPPAHRSSP
ncbi:MAG: hypothetical protein ACXVYS_11775 [Oryzihumus sp.]